MVVKDPDGLIFVLSGGTANTNPNLSLGGFASTAANNANRIVTNFLHNLFDEVTNAEAVTGEFEYRHCYVKNNRDHELRNCKIIFVSNAQLSAYSIVKIAKGTAVQNGAIEQQIANENTAPVGLDESSWKVPTSQDPLLLGTIPAGSHASIWFRRQVFTDALLANNQKIALQVFGDPPAGTGPSTPDPENPCPAGQHRDPVTGLCVDDVEEPCPEGFIQVGEECVPEDGGQGGGGGGGSPPTPEDVSVIVVGDIGCSTRGDLTVQVARDFRDGSIQFGGESTSLDLFIANGDLSYTSSSDCFIENIEFFGVEDITKISIGNHDDDENESSSLRREYLSYFGIPDGGYYSYDLQHIHFLAMDTQSDYGEGSPQHTFVVNDLQQARSNSAISWIVVYYHKPSVTQSGGHGPLTDFRDIYHPLFDQYKVDVILSGHNHNMQTSYPIKYNSSSPSQHIVVAQNQENVYTDVDGRIFVVAGGGGRGLYDLSGSRPNYLSFSNDSDHGICFMRWHGDQNSVVIYHISVTIDNDDVVQLEVLHATQLNKSI